MTLTTAPAAQTVVPAARRSRRLLLPLATLVAATGIALASGAAFSTSTASEGLVASGSLHQTNSNSVAFTGSNLRPGDVVTGSVTITNSGSLPAVFSLAEAVNENGFSTGSLSLSIDQGGSNVYSGPLGGAGTKALDGVWAAGESRTYSYTVTFSAQAPNADQNKVAKTTYTFSSVSAPSTPLESSEAGEKITDGVLPLQAP